MFDLQHISPPIFRKRKNTKRVVGVHCAPSRRSYIRVSINALCFVTLVTMLIPLDFFGYMLTYCKAYSGGTFVYKDTSREGFVFQVNFRAIYEREERFFFHFALSRALTKLSQPVGVYHEDHRWPNVYFCFALF